MKLCPRCQAQLEDGAAFCGSCGQAVTASPDATVAMSPAPAPAPVVAPAPAVAPVVAAEKPAKKPTKVPLVLGLILAGLGVACIVGGVLLLVL